MSVREESFKLFVLERTTDRRPVQQLGSEEQFTLPHARVGTFLYPIRLIGARGIGQIANGLVALMELARYFSLLGV